MVRITSDCPALDPFLVDYVILEAVTRKADYATNVLNVSAYTFPDGQDIEVLSWPMLLHLNNTDKSPEGREHVTMKIRTNSVMQSNFNVVSIENDINYGNIKCSVDEPKDLAEAGRYI